MPSSFGPHDYERALAARGLSGITVVHRETTDSTNDDAREIVLSPPGSAGDMAVVIAETQSRGRGRGGNSWSSPKGSISMTATAAGIGLSSLAVMPLAVGAAVARAVRDFGVAAEVKWPNDILIDGRKLCGILCESSLLGSSARVFIGIGVNVEADSVDRRASPSAASLQEHGGPIDRPAIVAGILARLVPALREDVPAADVVERWKDVSVPWWGHAIRFLEGEMERRMTLLDINPLGQLVARDDNGTLRSFVSGEIREIRSDGA